jgi:hypothetical protein
MPEYIRQVIREGRFEDELRALIAEAVAADQFVEAAEFLVARDPLIGSQTEDPRVGAVPIALVEGAQVVLYYTFDDSTVWLLSINRISNEHSAPPDSL